jgi:hypothetical protein
MIFSHVLYQLSYLAQPAIPAPAFVAGDEKPARRFSGAGGPKSRRTRTLLPTAPASAEQ